MTNMVNFLRIILILSIVTGYSCSKKSSSLDDKKAELSKLKSQLTTIQNRINVLEKEISMTGNSNQPGNAVHVNAIDIRPETFDRSVDVQGVVESDKAATISAKMPGPVIGIYVTPGTQVGAGKLLVQLDNAVLKSSLDEIQTQIDFAKTMYDKQKRLYDQKAGSEVQYLTAKNQLESLQKRLGSLKEQVNNANIYAPFAGVVDEVYPKVGETVSPGMPVVKLTGMSGIKVTADISETYISTVKPGNPVEVNLPEINQTVYGRVAVVAKSIDPKNRTFKIEVRLNSIPNNIRPNMAAGISIKDIVKPNAIVIPLSTVQHESDKAFVYVIENDNNKSVARKRYVKTGMTYKDRVEVLDGLVPGEKVITQGGYNVTDGQAVVVERQT